MITIKCLSCGMGFDMETKVINTDISVASKECPSCGKVNFVAISLPPDNRGEYGSKVL